MAYKHKWNHRVTMVRKPERKRRQTESEVVERKRKKNNNKEEGGIYQNTPKVRHDSGSVAVTEWGKKNRWRQMDVLKILHTQYTIQPRFGCRQGVRQVEPMTGNARTQENYLVYRRATTSCQPPRSGAGGIDGGNKKERNADKKTPKAEVLRGPPPCRAKIHKSDDYGWWLTMKRYV